MNENDQIQLAKRYKTPLYVYDGDLMTEKYRELYKLIQYRPLQILYAMKANYNPHILKLLEKEGAWIDAVSPGDVLMAKKCGFSSDRILYTANNITTEEMEVVVQEDVMFNIGSLSELKRYSDNFRGSQVCLRINPAIVAGADVKIQTGGDLTKFGILMTDVEAAMSIAGEFQIKIVGLHKHTGSGIDDKEKFLAAVNNLLSIAKPELFPDLRFIDLGGGLAVPYRPGEKIID
ncbi:MAG: hypothetical protein ABIN97_07470, partial [Ginsengibacter sp.]